MEEEGKVKERLCLPSHQPRSRGVVAMCTCDREGTRLRVDLGHHILFGLGDALVRRIGADRLAVVRHHSP